MFIFCIFHYSCIPLFSKKKKTLLFFLKEFKYIPLKESNLINCKAIIWNHRECTESTNPFNIQCRVRVKSPCLKVVGPSSVSNKRTGIILYTQWGLNVLKYNVFKFLENRVTMEIFFNVSKWYLLLSSSCLHLGTLEENYSILSVM